MDYVESIAPSDEYMTEWVSLLAQTPNHNDPDVIYKWFSHIKGRFGKRKIEDYSCVKKTELFTLGVDASQETRTVASKTCSHHRANIDGTECQK